MKSRESALRSKRFEAQERGRKAADLEVMVHDFEQMAVDLERQITAEEERTGIRDLEHFSYSTFAKSAALRRENLLTSVADLRLQLEDARRAYEEAMDELRKFESVDGRDTSERSSRRKSERNGAALG
jgi:flagellar export protein FliJ